MSKRNRKTTDRHHRRPKSQGGTRNYGNIIKLNKERHACWHRLFDNKTPQQIAEIINKYYLCKEYEFIVRRRQ